MQIAKAMSLLDEVLKLTKERNALELLKGKNKPGVQKIQVIDRKIQKISDDYYKLIPSDFGLRYMETFLTEADVRTQITLLEGLTDIDEAMNYLVQGVEEAGDHFFDFD